MDSDFSMAPYEMAQLVIETEHAWQALGKISYGPTGDEKKSIQFGRSLYIVENLKAGDISYENKYTCNSSRLWIANKVF